MNKIIKDRIEKAAESYVERKAFIAGASFALNHQWISLEERLPERDEGTDYSVEVFVTGGHHRTLSAIYDFNEGKFYNNGFFLSSTHWMPIPSLEGGE